MFLCVIDLTYYSGNKSTTNKLKWLLNQVELHDDFQLMNWEDWSLFLFCSHSKRIFRENGMNNSLPTQTNTIKNKSWHSSKMTIRMVKIAQEWLWLLKVFIEKHLYVRHCGLFQWVSPNIPIHNENVHLSS